MNKLILITSVAAFTMNVTTSYAANSCLRMCGEFCCDDASVASGAFTKVADNKYKDTFTNITYTINSDGTVKESKNSYTYSYYTEGENQGQLKSMTTNDGRYGKEYIYLNGFRFTSADLAGGRDRYYNYTPNGDGTYTEQDSFMYTGDTVATISFVDGKAIKDYQNSYDGTTTYGTTVYDSNGNTLVAASKNADGKITSSTEYIRDSLGHQIGFDNYSSYIYDDEGNYTVTKSSYKTTYGGRTGDDEYMERIGSNIKLSYSANGNILKIGDKSVTSDCAKADNNANCTACAQNYKLSDNGMCFGAWEQKHYTPAEAAKYLNEDDNTITITFKK